MCGNSVTRRAGSENAKMLAVVIHGYGGPEVIPGSLSEADIRVVVGNDA